MIKNCNLSYVKLVVFILKMVFIFFMIQYLSCSSSEGFGNVTEVSILQVGQWFENSVSKDIKENKILNLLT